MFTQTQINDYSYRIVGCAIEVHRHLGPGLLESVYQACLVHELKQVGFRISSQIHVPVVYKDTDLGGMLKLDILVNDLIVVELKAVEAILPLYKAQLLSYLKLTGKPKGLLINFNCENLVREGLIPLVTEEYSKLDK